MQTILYWTCPYCGSERSVLKGLIHEKSTCVNLSCHKDSGSFYRLVMDTVKCLGCHIECNKKAIVTKEGNFILRELPDDINDIYKEVIRRGTELIEQADIAPIKRQCILNGSWDQLDLDLIKTICLGAGAQCSVGDSIYHKDFFKALDMRVEIVQRLFEEWGIEFHCSLNIRLSEDWSCCFKSEDSAGVISARFYDWQDAIYEMLGILNMNELVSQAILHWRRREDWIKELQFVDFNTDS
jgi:hypothetical protein